MGFTRNKENFTCEHCGAHVEGDGYTNHCPKCLWSKHVDVNPGDRAAKCSGMMRPARIEGSTGTGYVIVHRCEKCGFARKQKVEPEDDMDAVLKVANSAM